MKLGDAVKTTSGGTPSRSRMEFYTGKYGWVKSKELNGSFITNTEETITDDAIAKSAAKLLPAKSILIAMYGATVGQYAVLSHPMTCNQAVCALLPNENYPYTYLFMVAKNIKEELANKAIGSAQQNISQVIIKDIDISSDIEKIKQFHKIVCPHFEVMEKNQKENETLATLRDTLLPKLMNGEIKL
jgi:type I restriction enzyme S subunit